MLSPRKLKPSPIYVLIYDSFSRIFIYGNCRTTQNTLWMKGLSKQDDERWIEAINASITNLNRRKFFNI